MVPYKEIELKILLVLIFLYKDTIGLGIVLGIGYLPQKHTPQQQCEYFIGLLLQMPEQIDMPAVKHQTL